MGSPVAPSSAISRQRVFRKTRRSRGPFHTATPRCTKPVPLGGWPHSTVRGSKSQMVSPVLPSSAITRL